MPKSNVIDKILLRIIKKCIKLGITLNLSQEKSVDNGDLECSGYFDDEEMVLAVAMDYPTEEWLYTLIHEYNHMLQWDEQCLQWRDSYIGETDVNELIDLWLEHKIELNKNQVHDYFQRSLNLELDCERRTIAMMLSEGVLDDPATYVKKANAYVLFYHAVAARRKWYKMDKRPYIMNEVWEKMPDSWCVDYTKAPDLSIFDPCFE
jgi:hypothetical protein